VSLVSGAERSLERQALLAWFAAVEGGGDRTTKARYLGLREENLEVVQWSRKEIVRLSS
jgi:hypothetical protein